MTDTKKNYKCECNQEKCNHECYYIKQDEAPLGVKTILGSSKIICQGATSPNLIELGVCNLNQPCVTENCCPTAPEYCTRITTGTICVGDCCDLKQYACTNFINGDLVINSPPQLCGNMTTLDNVFPHLLGINGNLWIVNTNYTSITGFKMLKWITGSIYIVDNFVLTQIPTFDKLVIVSASVAKVKQSTVEPCLCSPTVEGCPHQKRFARIVIVNNSALVNICGFNSVRQITDGIFISGNSCLVKIMAFGHLYNTISIYIANNNNLSVINAFTKIEQLQYINIVDNNAIGKNELEIFEFENLISVTFLFVVNNNKLRKLVFSKLCDIIAMSICKNNRLQCLKLPLLKTIFDFNIANNPKLDFISVDNLVSVKGSIVIAENAELKKLETFNRLKFVARVVKIINNKNLCEIKCFNFLKTIGQTTEICDTYNPICPEILIDFSTSISIALCPTNSDTIVSNWSCYGVDTTNYVIQFPDNDLTLPTDFYMLICNTETACTTLPVPPTPPKTSISYSIVISGNPNLQIIESFNTLKNIDSSIWIVNNNNLQTICSFGALNYAIDIGIRNNPKLSNIFGFQSLVFARDIVVLETPCLENWLSLESLEFVQTLTVETKTPVSISKLPNPLPSVLGLNYYYKYQ